MINSENEQRPRSRVLTLNSQVKTQAMILGAFIVIIWFLEVIDWLFLDGWLDGLGVKPRSLSGLKGILFMPFVHGGFGHLLMNTVPFLFLGALVMTSGLSVFFTVSGLSMLTSGLGVWLFASAGSVHIGASGIVFGFFGFLLTGAYFERSLRAILIAFVALFFYGGILWGLLPFRFGVSWLGHLFGFAGGVLSAYLINSRRSS